MSPIMTGSEDEMSVLKIVVFHALSVLMNPLVCDNATSFLPSVEATLVSKDYNGQPKVRKILP